MTWVRELFATPLTHIDEDILLNLIYILIFIIMKMILTNPFSTYNNTITSTLEPDHGLEGGPLAIQVADHHDDADAADDDDDDDDDDELQIFGISNLMCGTSHIDFFLVWQQWHWWQKLFWQGWSWQHF